MNGYIGILDFVFKLMGMEEWDPSDFRSLM